MKQGKSKLIPHVHPVKPVTDEEKVQQAARLLAQKREQYFSIILGAVIRTGKNTNVKECIDVAVEATDYAIERLYSLPPLNGTKEDEK